MKANIGIIGIVGSELKKDFRGTLQRLRALGYSGIELGLGSFEEHGGVSAVAEALRAADLKLITVHTMGFSLRDKFSAHLDVFAATGCKHATISWSELNSPESINADVAFYNEIAPRLREAGVCLCYHNHDHEFRLQFGGRNAMHMLLQQTRDSLAVHFDVAWATFGGVNPVAFLECYAGRVPLVHLKDLYDLTVSGCFTTVGTGKVDIAGSARAAIAAGAEWLTVEQDQPRGITGFELATASILNLRNLGIEPA